MNTVVERGHDFVGDTPDASRKILVFSPDHDVAQSLKWLLEDRSRVVSETQLFALRDRIATESPNAMLVDLYPFPSDILNVVNILKSIQPSIPIVFLYVYRNWRPEVEQAIREVSTFILYKPIEVEHVARVVSNLLAATS